ncbi:amidase [Methylobacterium symbioticum]|uniref:Glutamyl-tRNA(Gln) amidotransferase subunit A n=1 Tax=Methylobacterium symbioticum TaxID=2584084 RepID=A0A509E606_9HYPH|nr:amidase [Methylobacterium symbioticum]VUD69590.1 Glutamyl-tRNA(Gln) amidotransferase subunit A [Methylobacterium symbioticum]
MRTLPEDLAFAPAVTMLDRLARRDVSARALLELHLARIARFPQINAVIFADPDAARARADAADAALARGERWGPLHGLPMTVKETNNVAGWPTTYGDPAFASQVPAHSAVAVERLLAAGAIIFGKTNVPINALDWQSYNALHGTTRNPWDLTRTPGGSSGGATAALAAGLVPLELGSDAGGSIRLPAHFCGVFGHKPTPGVVPNLGNERPGSLLDNDLVVSGPLARSVADLMLALDVLAGPAGPDAAAWRLALPPPRITGLRGARVALISDSPMAEVDGRYRAVIRDLGQRLRAEGAEVVQDALPFDDHERHHATYLQLLRGAASGRLPQAAFDDAVRRSAAGDPDASPYVSRTVTAYAQRHRDWIAASEIRAGLKRDWSAFFTRFDVVVAPAGVGPAFPVDEERPREERTLTVNGHQTDYNDQLFWAGLATLASLPATAAPVGSIDGLPVGVQIIGAYLEDRTTLAFAAELERLNPFTPPTGFT